MNKDFIKKIASKEWRLNNLYTILDKNSVKKILKLNEAQKIAILRVKHKKKLILKTRQQGISTGFLADNLDSCIFQDNFQAGIQSYGINESNKLAKKAKLMWEEFDPDIKKLLGISLVTNNNNGMSFSNGSILRIGNFRGDTLNSLHVSELAKISAKYPEKAQELKTGAFEAVGKDNAITIETTSEGPVGLFFEMWTKAMVHKAKKAPMGPFDYEPIFISWLIDEDCRINTPQEITYEMEQYFLSLELLWETKLLTSQKWWYVSKYNSLGKESMQKEYPSTPEEAFMAIREGTYYAQLFMDHILSKQRIISNLYDSNLSVYVAMDLGMNDTMVMIFFQLYRDELRIIDEYHNSGEPIHHYVGVLRSKTEILGYRYEAPIALPHDARVRELGSGRSRLEVFRQLGCNCKVLPKADVHTGIALVREWIPFMYIDSSLDYIIKTFQNYSKQRNSSTGAWSNTPLHDEWSNPADAIRYVVMSIPQAIRLPNRKKVELPQTSGFDV